MAEKKKMSEAQKKKMAEGRKKAAEKKAETKEIKAQVPDEKDARIAELEARIEALARQQAQPQIIQMSPGGERVHFVWMGEVADDNIIEFGPGGIYGRIEGKTGSFMVPKDDLSRVLTSLNRHLLDKRWLMIVSGLNEEERQAFNVDYREGEILDRAAFGRMIDLGEEMPEIYPKLCKGHREMVVKRYYEAWSRRDRRINRGLISTLNEVSKALGKAEGDFVEILREMNAEEAGEGR